MVRWIVQQLGLPQSVLRGDLDRQYIDRLLQFVRGSGLHRAVILAQDHVHDRTGTPRPGIGTFFVPNRYVLDLADRHPELLPGVSIHPARPDTQEELDACLARGAVLLKLNPAAQEIDLADPRFAPFWDRLAAAGLPLLCHTGGEHTLRVLRPEFADPGRLEPVLRRGVTVIAAHGAAARGPLGCDYLPALLPLLDRYPNLYCDTSAFNSPLVGRGYGLALDPRYRDRFLHGSDLPVPCSGLWPWLHRRVGWRDWRAARREPNPLARDLLLKRAAGLPPDAFTRAGTLLRQRGRAAGAR